MTSNSVYTSAADRRRDQIMQKGEVGSLEPDPPPTLLASLSTQGPFNY
jgi:hypothetical protein